MANSKIIYFGQTLIDLTQDTVQPDKLLAGYTAHNAAGEIITGTCDFDVNSQDATAAAGELLIGKTAYVKGTKVTGSMPNNEGASGTIGLKDETYKIAAGYHDGSGTVGLAETEKAKLIAENIRQGITLFGVEGAMTGTEDANAETVEVTASNEDQVIIPNTEQGYNYIAQVTVKAVPYAETENTAGGMTITIG